jgi:hypothetical protein
MLRKQVFGTHCAVSRLRSTRAYYLRSREAVGRSPMTRDEDGISNSFWLLFASLLTSVAIVISALMAGIV